MGLVFKELGDAEERFLNTVTLPAAGTEASAQGFHIHRLGGKSNQDLLILMKSNTWDSLQARIFLE